jgi:hypothetical protein
MLNKSWLDSPRVNIEKLHGLPPLACEDNEPPIDWIFFTVMESISQF